MSKNKGRDYEIGYQKPPKTTQFKRGKSGNPAGRPKGSKNSMTILTAVFNEKIAVSRNGKTQYISKFEAICTQVANNALKGDLRAQRLALELVARGESRATAAKIAEESTRPIRIVLSPTDLKL